MTNSKDNDKSRSGRKKRSHLMNEAEAKSHSKAQNVQPKAQLLSSMSVGDRAKEAQLRLVHKGGLYCRPTEGQEARHEIRVARQLAVTPRVTSIHIPSNRKNNKI